METKKPPSHLDLENIVVIPSLVDSLHDEGAINQDAKTFIYHKLFNSKSFSEWISLLTIFLGIGCSLLGAYALVTSSGSFLKNYYGLIAFLGAALGFAFNSKALFFKPFFKMKASSFVIYLKEQGFIKNTSKVENGILAAAHTLSFPTQEIVIGVMVLFIYLFIIVCPGCLLLGMGLLMAFLGGPIIPFLLSCLMIAIALPIGFGGVNTAAKNRVSLFLMITGKIAFLVNLPFVIIFFLETSGDPSESLWYLFPVGMLCLIFLTYKVYSSSFERFLSAITSLLLFGYSLSFLEEDWSFKVFIMIHLLVITIFVLKRDFSSFWRPIFYAVISSLTFFSYLLI